jgi:C4-dicarboxylate-specific signal transduction histidine kinase
LPTAQQQIATLELENAELRAELEQAIKLAYLGMMATTVAPSGKSTHSQY